MVVGLKLVYVQSESFMLMLVVAILHTTGDVSGMQLRYEKWVFGVGEDERLTFNLYK